MRDMLPRPVLAAALLFVTVAGCGGSDPPDARTVVSTYCETSGFGPYVNTTFQVWSDGSRTEVSKAVANVPCPR